MQRLFAERVSGPRCRARWRLLRRHGQATTGSISGRVLSSDRQPLPGVTIAVTSPMLQGVRTAVTSESGDYLIRAAAARYVLRVVRARRFSDAYTNAARCGRLQRAGRHDDVADRRQRGRHRCRPTRSRSSNTAQVATNFKQDLMATLPSNRTIDAVMLMAPSVHATGPGGAFSINGSLCPTRTSTR